MYNVEIVQFVQCVNPHTLETVTLNFSTISTNFVQCIRQYDYRNLRSSLPAWSRVRISPWGSRTAPLTLRTREQLLSSMKSTRIRVTPPREPVLQPRTLMKRANFPTITSPSSLSLSFSCANGGIYRISPLAGKNYTFNFSLKLFKNIMLRINLTHCQVWAAQNPPIDRCVGRCWVACPRAWFSMPKSPLKT